MLFLQALATTKKMNYLHGSVKVFLNKGAELGKRMIVVYAFTILEISGWQSRLLAKKNLE